MSSIAIQISLFGVFRNSGLSEIRIDAPVGSDIGEVKQLLADKFAQEHPNFQYAHLIENAVLADASRVLNQNERFFDACQLAILPPVCGVNCHERHFHN